mmetsp:Transcript_69750/g.110647  ORF Transcript_69750/g.110647 Transcript_69750/m.110647 type:complete len:269 (+) Transcript_69750:525-1331(+)
MHFCSKSEESVNSSGKDDGFEACFSACFTNAFSKVPSLAAAIIVCFRSVCKSFNVFAGWFSFFSSNAFSKVPSCAASHIVCFSSCRSNARDVDAFCELPSRADAIKDVFIFSRSSSALIAFSKLPSRAEAVRALPISCRSSSRFTASLLPSARKSVNTPLNSPLLAASTSVVLACDRSRSSSASAFFCLKHSKNSSKLPNSVDWSACHANCIIAVSNPPVCNAVTNFSASAALFSFCLDASSLLFGFPLLGFWQRRSGHWLRLCIRLK